MFITSVPVCIFHITPTPECIVSIVGCLSRFSASKNSQTKQALKYWQLPIRFERRSNTGLRLAYEKRSGSKLLFKINIGTTPLIKGSQRIFSGPAFTFLLAHTTPLKILTPIRSTLGDDDTCCGAAHGT